MSIQFKLQYIEFDSAVDSEGKLSGTMHACTIKTKVSGSSTTTSYEWNTIPVSYMKGNLTTEKRNWTLLKDNSNGANLYCTLSPATRLSGEGIYGTFDFGGLTVTLDKNGTYSTSRSEGYYEFEDGIISFKDGILQGTIAIYDGKNLYELWYYYKEIAELPNPLPDPINSSIAVDEVGATYVNVSSAIPETKDLMEKILHYSDYVKVSNEDSSSYETKTCDIYLAFGTDNSTGTLSVTMIPYNKEHTTSYEQKTYSYKDGILAPSTDSQNVYRIFHVMNKFYINPYGGELNRISGEGLYSSFSIDELTITLTDKGVYTYSSGGLSFTGEYTNSNGIITLKNETQGDGQMLYDGQKLYMLKELIEASSLPNKS